MNRGIERAEQLFRRIIKLEEAICVVLQIIMLLICFAAVVKRYFFNAPWAWTDEIQLLLLVIYGYLAISIDVYRDNHVALTGMYKHLSKRGKVVLDLIRHVLLGGFFCLMTYYGWKVYGIKARKLLTVTGNCFYGTDDMRSADGVVLSDEFCKSSQGLSRCVCK